MQPNIHDPEQHPSFGILTFQRVTHGTSDFLFGSSIQHQHRVRLEVSTATRHRSLGVDHILADQRVLLADLSIAQFDDAITNINHQAGTPVTLRFVSGDHTQRPDPPKPEIRQDFEAEHQAVIADIMTKLAELVEHPRMPAAARRKAQTIRQELTNAAPFLQEQFTRQMDRTVTEAKADVEAFPQARTGQAELPNATIPS